MLFSPERVALAGVLTYLVLWLLAPLKLVFPVSWDSLLYVALGYGAFFVGCLLLPGGSRRVVPPQTRSGFSKRAFWTIAALGAFGMVLRLYDKIFIRGINLADSALESRELLADAEAGPLAALSGLLYPFCYVPLILWWARPAGRPLSRTAKWMALLLFTLPALDALVLLSRSQMLVALSMMYFSAACVLYRGRALHIRIVKPLLIGLLVGLLLAMYAFASRLDQMEIDLVFSILNSAYGYVITPNQWALSSIEGDGLLASALGGLTPVLQYYLHGLFEFGLLWSRPDVQVHTYGVQFFAPYVKAFGVLGILTAPDFSAVSIYYREGVFSTFFGPLWIDFGWGGILFMLIFGVLVKYLARQARQGFIAVMPLYAYLCVVIFFMPVVNFFTGAQGMYIVNALAISIFLLRQKKGRRVPAAGMLSRRV